MTPHIEDTFVPETVNEVRLLNRIQELKIAAYEANAPLAPTISGYNINDPMTLTGQVPSTLTLAAELKAGWDKQYKFGINGIAHLSDGSIHMGYYMPHEAMTHWTKDAAVQHLGEMHRVMIQHLARQI